MPEHDPMVTAITNLIDKALPTEAQPYVLGDFITAAEIAFVGGSKVIVLADELKPSHLRLLLKAADQVVSDRIVDPGAADTSEPR